MMVYLKPIIKLLGFNLVLSSNVGSVEEKSAVWYLVKILGHSTFCSSQVADLLLAQELIPIPWCVEVSKAMLP